jgi:hypothetical protein
MFFQDFFRVGHTASDHLVLYRICFLPENFDVIVGGPDKQQHADFNGKAVFLVIGIEINDHFLDHLMVFQFLVYFAFQFDT